MGESRTYVHRTENGHMAITFQPTSSLRVTIVFEMDAGFYDQAYYKLCDRLDVVHVSVDQARSIDTSVLSSQRDRPCLEIGIRCSPLSFTLLTFGRIRPWRSRAAIHLQPL